MKKIYLSVLFLLTGTLVSISQTHGVKLNILQLAASKITLNYEYVIDQSSSVQLSLSGLLPRTTPATISNLLYEDDLNTTTVFNQNTVTGYSIQAEYRRYTSEKAPHGFYFGPWIRHYNYFIQFDADVADNSANTNYNYKTRVGLKSLIGAGFQIGNQWLINDNFVIDFCYLGLGVNYGSIYGQFESNDPSLNASDLEDDVNNAPGPTIKVSENGDKFKISAPFISLAWRTAFRIGYFF